MILSEVNAVNIFRTDLAQLIKENDFDGIKALIISKIPLVCGVIAIIVLGIVIANLISKLVVKGLQLKGVDPSIHGFIKTIVKFAVEVIFILSALSTLGIDVNSFVAALAAGGLTAGLGLQHSVSQFASGLQILINHPFRAGDFIDIGSVSGTVREIKIMYTVLITLDNRKVIVPNSHITDCNIINFNAEENRRMDLHYSISYSEDIGKAREAVSAAAGKCEKVLDNPKPRIEVISHAESSIELIALVWCRSTDYWDAFFSMQENVKREFDSRGITIPFNQLDVHIDK